MSPDLDRCQALIARAREVPPHRDLAAHREQLWGQMLECLEALADRVARQETEIRRLQSTVRTASDQAVRAPDA